MKICSSILLVSARNGKPSGNGVEIRPALLQRYANQIMGVPVAKVTSMVDILATGGVMSVADPASDSQIVVQDIDFLEQLIQYLNEENLLEPSKRHDVSIKGFMIMSLISKHIAKFPKDVETGTAAVNVAQVRKIELRDGKELFRMEDFQELAQLGYASNINIKNNDEAISILKPEAFVQAYRLQKVVMGIRAANEQKSKGGR